MLPVLQFSRLSDIGLERKKTYSPILLMPPFFPAYKVKQFLNMFVYLEITKKTGEN